jgi:hypothetical protein
VGINPVGRAARRLSDNTQSSGTSIAAMVESQQEMTDGHVQRLRQRIGAHRAQEKAIDRGHDDVMAPA